jgi:colanic acid/amylovoran biosynthesis glycosyltransferase
MAADDWSPLRAYRRAVEYGPRWAAAGDEPAARPRIGYHVWRYPALTGTYVQREIAALRQAGLQVEVFAEEPEALDRLDPEARAEIATTTYLQPLAAVRRRALQRVVMQRDAATVLQAFAHVTRQRYAAHKSRREDRRVFRHAVMLAGAALERGITHLHCPWAHLSAFITLLAARMAGVPYSVQARASTDLYRHRVRWSLEENLSAARFIVTNCAFNRAFIESAGLARGAVPIHVIYEGLDPTRFVPAPRTRSVGAPLRILSVGRLSEEKGFVYLLRAVALLRERGRDVRCVIVGGGDDVAGGYLRELRELRRSLRLEDIVQWTGTLPFDRVLEQYRQADVFVLASVIAADGGRDVTPNAVIEAMAMRLPVLATRMTAIGELVEDGVSGLLLPPRHPEALAQALERLADDRALAESLGGAARRRVEERFDIRRNARRYLELFSASEPAR